jgi:hypothetical protein
MPQGKKHIYFLRNETGLFYYWSNGVANTISTPTPLQYAPDGWRDISVHIQRNSTYFAVDRVFTNPLDFVEDGAQILKYHYYKFGVKSKLYLVIAKEILFIDATHYGFYYTNLYTGQIDFSTFSHQGPKVVAQIMEGDPVKQLRAYENVKYEIPLTVEDTIKVKMDGIMLRETINWRVIPGITSGPHEIAMVYINREGSSLGVVASQLTQYRAGGLDNDLFRVTQDIQQMRIFGTIRVKYGPVSSGVVTYKLVISPTKQYTLGTIPGTAGTFTVPIDFTFDALEGEQFHIFSLGQPLSASEYFESNISIAYRAKYKTTYIRAMRPRKLFDRTAGKMGITRTESNALDAYSFIVLASGDAIRGLPNSVIKTSISDIYTSFNTILSVGMGVENFKLILERRVDLITYSNPVDIGAGRTLKVQPATDYMFNSVKIGSPEQQYEDVNGKQEFNNTHTYTVTQSEIAKELQLISVFRFDSYGAEFVRINLEGKTTTDNKSDNDVFALHIKPSPIIDPVEGEVWELDRTLNTSVTGLLEPKSVFNLWLSPKQCLFRNGPYLRSCFYKNDADVLEFQTTEKNREVAVPGVDEDANVSISALGDPLFTANLISITAPGEFSEAIVSSPRKSYQVSYEGVTLLGIPQKVGAQPETEKAQEYLLLSAPINNLELLIEKE